MFISPKLFIVLSDYGLDKDAIISHLISVLDKNSEIIPTLN